MTIDAKHRGVSAMEPQWSKVRDFVAGGDKVKPYVMPLPGHDQNTIGAYAQRAYYLPAIARSIDAFTGLVMNPAPVIVAPDALTPYLDDVTYDGEPARRMIGRTVREVIAVGRCAVLVDYPRAPGDAQMSVAEAEAQGLRPYARFYAAEDVLDWRSTMRGGKRILSMLKLRERFDQADTADEWSVTEVEQVRVLDLVKDQYRQRVFRKGGVDASGKPIGGWVQIDGDIYPKVDGQPMDELPAVVFGPDTLDAGVVDAPPVLEMVEIACAHLQNSASMEWALMWVGNPTPVFINLHKTDGQPIHLGSSQGLSLGEGGDAKFMQLGPEGVGAIAAEMTRKEKHMAAVGARLLADETGAQVARDTVIIQRAGEHSVLANIAVTIGDGWQRVLGYMARWIRADGDISVTLNTDFVPQGLSPGELGELINGVMQGQLSSRDLFALLQKRGVIRPDKSFDEHRDEIDEDGAMMLQGQQAAGVNDPQADNQQGGNPQNDQQKDNAA